VKQVCASLFESDGLVQLLQRPIEITQAPLDTRGSVSALSDAINLRGTVSALPISIALHLQARDGMNVEGPGETLVVIPDSQDESGRSGSQSNGREQFQGVEVDRGTRCGRVSLRAIAVTTRAYTLPVSAADPIQQKCKRLAPGLSGRQQVSA
jgi:hypothetical protein